MSKDFIDNEIDEAHQLIKQNGFNEAVRQLKLLKYRIHEPQVKDEIRQFEKEHDEKLEERFKEIDAKSVNPLVKDDEKLNQIVNYSMSYLEFYDRLRKEYELY